MSAPLKQSSLSKYKVSSASSSLVTTLLLVNEYMAKHSLPLAVHVKTTPAFVDSVF
jgi:hypothetical protein